MPYITKDEQSGLASGQDIRSSGRLNFLLTCLIRRYLKEEGLQYETLNDIVGALESAKAEFQRRVVAPYEDQKIKENGDVYPHK